MADITSAIQAVVDSGGTYTLPSGTSTISSPIILEGKERFWLKGVPKSTLEWTGAADLSFFSFVKDVGAGTYNNEKTLFTDIEAVSETSGVSFFRSGSGEQPGYLTMHDCTLTTTGAYAIDIDQNKFTTSPHFENMRTFGSGALRMRAWTQSGEVYWFCSLAEIKHWVHEGSNRVGPAFDLSGCRGMRIMNIWDKGDPSLLPALRGNWECPVSLRINSVGFPSDIINYIVSYDTDFTNAPGCWLHEFRADSGYSVGQHEQINVHHMTMHDDNIDTGVKHVRFMGGTGTAAAHGLLVTLDACEDLDGDKMVAGGKVLVRARNIWYNPGNTALATNMQNFVEAMDTNTWATPILTATDRPPRETITTPLYEEGETLYDNYAADVGDYEDILEAL